MQNLFLLGDHSGIKYIQALQQFPDLSNHAKQKIILTIHNTLIHTLWRQKWRNFEGRMEQGWRNFERRFHIVEDLIHLLWYLYKPSYFIHDLFCQHVMCIVLGENLGYISRVYALRVWVQCYQVIIKYCLTFSRIMKYKSLLLIVMEIKMVW